MTQNDKHYSEDQKEFISKGLRLLAGEKPQSESVHYSKPIDKGMVTELQPDKIVIIEKENPAKMYKSGYIVCLSQLERYIKETRGIDQDITEWIEQQRKTLNSYL
jgi:hypothetical protein